MWHVWRRKYDLVVGGKQWGLVDSPMLAWEFPIHDGSGVEIARLDKGFTGLAGEVSQRLWRFPCDTMMGILCSLPLDPSRRALVHADLPATERQPRADL